MSELADYRVAVISRPIQDSQGFGGFLLRGLKQVCSATHFTPGEEKPGYDCYLYVDDAPTLYEEPKCRPAAYIAMDMVIPQLWFLQTAEQYFQRLKNFDWQFVTSTTSRKYCNERGMEPYMTGFGCDPELHKPWDIPREFDWIAAWHNTDGRIEASNRAADKYLGRVTYRCHEYYAEAISSAWCCLNWLRGNLVNMRVFETMAIGTPLITTRNPDMAYWGLTEWEHYLGYDPDDIGGMLEQIAWVKEHKAQALEMASRAREFVLEHHTYQHRAIEIMGHLCV